MQAALGILHLVGLLLIVAVGSNYALFFDQLRTTGRADEDTLASLMLANLTTVVSFGLIAISDIPALSSIGRVVAPGALLALLLSAAFARHVAPPDAGLMGKSAAMSSAPTPFRILALAAGHARQRGLACGRHRRGRAGAGRLPWASARSCSTTR
jgi:hypothetical protein